MDQKNDILNNAINKENVLIVDCRNSGKHNAQFEIFSNYRISLSNKTRLHIIWTTFLDELVKDGNLKSLGVKNVMNIPTDQIENALQLSNEDFEVSKKVSSF